MNYAKRFPLAAFLLAIFSFLFVACGSAQLPSSPPSSSGCPAANTSCSSATATQIPTGNSATNIPLYIASTTSEGSYIYANEPLVSVTICNPNHTSGSQCTVVSNILLDTGSYGLRVFASAIASNVTLTQQTATLNGKTVNLAECAEFGSGADWGPIKTADIILGGQTATNIPIHVIDYNYSTMPSGCASLCPDTDPCTAGYNGILGVGIFKQDCGEACTHTDDSNPGIYFGCDSTGCYDGYTGNCSVDGGGCLLAVSTSNQTINPISKFSAPYNNGIVLTLPSVSSATGANGVHGHYDLGIGSPTGVSVFQADPNGQQASSTDSISATIATVYSSTLYGGTDSSSSAAFLDSGSNALYFPGNYSSCSDATGFFCATGSDSASMGNYDSSSGSQAYTFSVGNADTLLTTGNSAFYNLAGTASSMFDWGLPFFFGRSVYVGLETETATVNTSTTITGPYWAVPTPH